MQITTDYRNVSTPHGVMRTFVAAPANDQMYPPVLFYTDIFQLTESSIRWAKRLASYGFVVATPEIYYRIEEPGTVLEFDDAGKARGQADVEQLRADQFDEDIALAIDWLRTQERVLPGPIRVTGHCTGGHIGFRAAYHPDVIATALWYPTGLQNGKLGADADSGSLARADEIAGKLLLVFGKQDPHTSAAEREVVRARLAAANVNFEWREFDAAHAFARDVGPRWDPAATDEAFAATVAFLRA